MKLFYAIISADLIMIQMLAGVCIKKKKNKETDAQEAPMVPGPPIPTEIMHKTWPGSACALAGPPGVTATALHLATRGSPRHAVISAAYQ